MATVINKTEESADLEKSNDFIEIQCNWEIKTDKKLRDTVSIICASEAPERYSMNYGLTCLISYFILITNGENMLIIRLIILFH